MKPYQIKIALAISASDPTKQGGISFLVMKDDEVLHTPIRFLYAGERSEGAASQLFKDVTGFESSWVNIRQVGFFDHIDPEAAIVLFGVSIQEPVPLQDKYAIWVDADTLMKHHVAYGLAALAANYTRILKTS